MGGAFAPGALGGDLDLGSRSSPFGTVFTDFDEAYVQQTSLERYTIVPT